MTNIEFQSGAIDAGGCISSAWDLLKSNYGLYLGIAVITMVLTGCIPCFNIFLIGPVMGGVAFVVLRAMRGEPVEFGMMFQGFQKFVPLMVIGLIQSIPSVIAQVFQYTVRFAEIGLNGTNGGNTEYFESAGIGAVGGVLLIVMVIVALAFFVIGIIWWACFFFAIPLAMEYDLGPVDAIKLSARAAMANIGGLILLLVLSTLIVLLGVLLLCIGALLISMPILYIANVFAYRMVFPRLEQRFDMNPPPPSVYGGGYGQQGFA